MYQRILVPLDGSDAARGGLEEAIRFASDQHACLRFVCVLSDVQLNTPPMHGLTYGDVLGRRRIESQAIVDAACAAASKAGVSAEGALLEYHRYQIDEAIIKEAERWQADLIVMGTHGRHGISRLILGSEAEGVLRQAPVPVLLVRAQL